MSEAGTEREEPDARARTILIAGTASHVGKSTVAAGLCRMLADRGVAVSPYKAQNMSNNARVVVRPEWGDGDGRQDATDATHEDECVADGRGEDEYAADDQSENEREDGDVGEAERVVTNTETSDRWGEIGVSQFVQARAARITPTTDTNPVLLKPRGGGESQLVLQGRALEHLAAGEYYDEHWGRALEVARESHARLASAYDVVIAEGAGSIAEINLHDRDLANIETARFADAEILLMVDIERGGAFASLYGTLELLPEDVRERVIGAVITKFRGDASILEPGIEEIESLTGVPVLGVLPYDDPGLPEEDSVSLPAVEERAIDGGDDGVPESQSVTIAVPRLPRISNATDLEVLAEVPGVRVSYVPIVGDDRADANSTDRPLRATAPTRATLESADAVVIPGTKNTVDDLLALRESGFEDLLTDFDGPVVGLCGGYQMLGERITNATLEGTDEHTRETVDGFGLLPVETAFEETKHLERTTVTVEGVGVLEGASGTAAGYEIHAGRTTVLDGTDVSRPLGPNSAACGDVLGTYLHGVFDNRSVREAFLETVFARAGLERPGRSQGSDDVDGPGTDGAQPQSPYDRAAHLLEEFLDLEAFGEPFTQPPTRE